MTTQGICAVMAGALADLVSTAPVMAVLGVASLLVSLALGHPLTRAAAAALGPRGALR